MLPIHHWRLFVVVVVYFVVDKEIISPRRDSNPQSLPPEGSALSIRPQGQHNEPQREAKKAPEVRLELTTYRLTAGRATDCAIQERYTQKKYIR